MGRAIKPTAIRRVNGGPIEALSASGFWAKEALWSDGTRINVVSAVRSVLGTTLDSILRTEGDDWHYELDEQDEPDTSLEAIYNDIKADQDQDQESDSDSDSDSDESDADEAQAESTSSNQPPTIEDIIRQIAGEMDATMATALVDTLNQALAEQLASFSPKLDSADADSLLPITVRVEVKSPTVTTTKDGIFHKQFGNLTSLVSMGQHCYLPGPPGTGKSHAAEQVASVLDWRFASISLGPTTPESRLWGGMDAHGNFFEPPFVKLARHASENPDSGAVFCLDELDNGHAGVIATLNSAMANGWFTAPNGDVITMGKNFTIVGAANTFGTGPTAEFAGRNKLDPATLDRFAYLPWDTDLAVEKALVLQYLDAAAGRAWLEVWRTCRKNVKDNGLKVFVTMRGCVNGARLIAGGIDPNDVLEMVLLNKLPEDQARKVSP